MPLNVVVLRTLATGPTRHGELRRVAGSPAQTTLRTHLKRLTGADIVERRRRDRFPGNVDYELTPAGQDLITVLDVLDDWLKQSPQGEVATGSHAGKAAISAFANAWSTGILRLLAGGPRSLTELDDVIGSLSYPSLERRLSGMRLAGQVEPRPSDRRGTPYVVTDWLRRGIAPLAAAVRWERRHLPRQTPPFGRVDFETAFLLAMPLLRISEPVTGSCRLAAEIRNTDGSRLAGVLVELRDSVLVSCTTDLRGHPDAWALGPAHAWLGALIDRDVEALELGGDTGLATALVDALHDCLFVHGSPAQT